MTKKEAMRQTAQENVLLSLGFTREEAEQLRRISNRLHSWYEKECGDGNGCIERDDDTDKVYWHNAYSGRRYPIRDLERGAERRLKAIIAARNSRPNTNPDLRDGDISAYLQTDPRGAALYIIRPGDVPEGKDVSGFYNRGICVY
jgi:hypothetical protein